MFRNKYGNKKVEVDGIKFDSKWEAERYVELSILNNVGKISDLELQVREELQTGFKNNNGVRIRPITYKADFKYIEDGKIVFEDAKGFETEVFKIKWKMLQYKYKDDPDVVFRLTFKGGKSR
jgi:hypothetical protein